MTSTPDYQATEVPRTPNRDRVELINELIENADDDDEVDAIYDEHLNENETHPYQFSYVDRRAYLFRKVKEKTDPRNLDSTQTQLGDMFGVTQKTISNDLQAVRDFIGERVGDLALERTELLAHKTVEELREEGEFRDAWRTHKEYMEWLADAGIVETEPDKVEFTVDPGKAYMQMVEEAAEERAATTDDT